MGRSIIIKQGKTDLSMEVKRKQQILETAAQVFARLGYTASVDQIAEEMGVTKGHIYYYFSSKQEILFQIFRQAMDFFLAEISAVNLQNLPADQRLKAIFKKHIIAICENRAIMTVFMDLRRDLLPVHWREIAASRNEYENLLQGLIREGVAKGYFIADNEKVISYTLLGAINWVYVWFQEKGELGTEKIADIMSDYLLRGLKKWPKVDTLENGKTINAISEGESASFSKTFTTTDIHTYAGISGDYYPLHADGKHIVHGGLLSSLISPVIGMIFPGGGSIAREITFRHESTVFGGDTITASAEVVEIDFLKNRLKMKLHWINQKGEEVASGEAVVTPPRQKESQLSRQKE